LYGAGLTDAGTPCACFRDHGMSADAPKPSVTGSFFPSEQVSVDETRTSSRLQRHLLVLIDVGALISIVVLQLFAAELVRLPVIKRQAKQIELSLIVNLELHEATRPWALVFHHRGKPAGGHQLSREYVAIPWIEL
jgi:hypothetical protein